ncbi:MAG: guanylate kinase [Phycisphaerales bacterium]
MTSPPPAGMLLVISGPSGVGKTTITREVQRAFPGSVFSVSATTRTPTPQDRPGVDYHFVSDEAFDDMIARGEFLEHANVFGKKYGTPRAWVDEQLSAGRLVILEIDVQGAQNVRRQMPGAFCMFVLPPSEDVLLQRLRSRGRDSEETIQRRFGAAKREIETARTCGIYDVFLVNSDLRETIEQAIASVRAARASR